MESRYLADERRRESPETTSPGRRAIKAQDAKIGAEGAKRKEQDRRNAARAVKAPGVGESMLVKLGLTPEQQRVDLLKVPLGGRFPDKSKPTTSQRTRLEREIVANAESAEAKRLQVAAGVDLRSQGVANGQRATSAVTIQAPDPTPLVARGGWASKQLPPGQRGGDLAIREARSIRNNPGGSILDNRVERVNVQIDASELNNERSNRAPKQDPRSNQNRNRNRLIRDILGTTAAGAGSVALGAAIGSTYNRDEQSNNGGALLMDYSPQDIQQGNRLKSMAEETPTNFGTVDGATEHTESKGFGKTRFAGQKGARIVELMQDPVESQRTQNWMTAFNLSNEGMQFNQARMMMANPQPQQEQ